MAAKPAAFVWLIVTDALVADDKRAKFTEKTLKSSSKCVTIKDDRSVAPAGPIRRAADVTAACGADCAEDGVLPIRRLRRLGANNVNIARSRWR